MSQIDFKIFLLGNTFNLNKKNHEPDIREVRRFNSTVDILNCPVFNWFCQKAEELMPILAGKTYVTYWRDEDGDFIKIVCDEEMMQAIRNMRSRMPTVKFYVWKHDVLENGSFDFLQSLFHIGVVCDSCQVGPLQGFRYKCVECEDFDLCMSCEARGAHAEHNMIRFSSPIVFGSETYRILRKTLLRNIKKTFAKNMNKDHGGETGVSSEEDIVEGDYGTNCPFVEKRRRHEHHENQRRRHGMRHGRRHHVDPAESRKRCYDMVCDAAMKAGGVAGAAVDGANLQVLRNLKQTLANLLDPLGNNVESPKTAANVEIPPAGSAKPDGANTQPQAKVNPSAPEYPSGTAPPFENPDQKAKIQEIFQTAIQHVPNIVTAVQQITENLAQQHIESGEVGWTVINADEEGSSKQKKSANASGVTPSVDNAEPAIPTASQSAAPLYPDLTPPQASPHPNVMVQRGLDTLLSLGFSNEGGILTQILEIHNGDIYKALDVLHVFNK